MIFLVGEARGAKQIKQLRGYGWGRMFIRVYTEPWPDEPWGFDNGAFGCWKKGIPFDEPAFWERLRRALTMPTRPYLAVLPDIVAGGQESLRYSLEWYERVGNYPFPWYLAVQDGMAPAQIDALMPFFAGLFLGGSTAFKATAATWAEIAHRHGRKFHYGRCGTPRRLAHARSVGADSADSAFPFWALQETGTVLPGRSRNLRVFLQHWLHGDPQRRLPMEANP